jgi:pyruvate formate lyase activating enzyme
MLGIQDITPFTFLDFPDEISCIVWFAGCNLRCVYCHNPDIVHGRGQKSFEDYETFMKSRRGKLSGVVLSGGEPTLCADLPRYARAAKEMGFKVKLDTNGTRPEMIAALLDAELLDMVALDYKCLPEHAEVLLGTAKFMPLFEDSLRRLIAAGDGLRFEVRTTFYSSLQSDGDLARMIEYLGDIGYRGVYYVQNIVSTGEKTLGHIPPPTRVIDTAALPAPRGFSIKYRNFGIKPDEVARSK